MGELPGCITLGTKHAVEMFMGVPAAATGQPPSTAGAARTLLLGVVEGAHGKNIAAACEMPSTQNRPTRWRRVNLLHSSLFIPIGR